MSTARYFATLTNLPDGRVLAVGGLDSTGSPVANAEIFDPVADKWTTVASPLQARYAHTAVLLKNGLVLIAGGYSGVSELSECELYNPVTNVWTLTGSMNQARAYHTMTLIVSGAYAGDVLAVGGGSDCGAGAACSPLSSVEYYNPSSGQWTLAGSLSTARYLHAATLLGDEQTVLITGGVTDVLGDPTNSAEKWDGSMSSAGNMTTAHAGATATLLPGGTVFVVGGMTDSNGTTSGAVDEYASGSWSAGPSLPYPRAYHAATLNPDGSLNVIGGYGDGNFSIPVTLLPQTLGGSASISLGDLEFTGGGTTGSGECSGPDLCDGVGADPPELTLGSGNLTITADDLGTTGTPTYLGPSGTIFAPEFQMTNGSISTASGTISGLTSGSDTSYFPLPTDTIVNGIISGTFDTPVTGATFDVNVATPGGGTVEFTAGSVTGLEGNIIVPQIIYADAMIYAAGSWTYRDWSNAADFSNAVLTLAGSALSAGGRDATTDADSVALANYLSATQGNFSSTVTIGPRYNHTASLLTDGSVLLAGGDTGSSAPSAPTASWQLVNPTATGISYSGSMGCAREYDTATTLQNGNVLICGGYTYPNGSNGNSSSCGNSSSSIRPTNTCELYSASAHSFTFVPSMLSARAHHTATLLFTGQVLVTGGVDQNGAPQSSAEIYDLFLSTWVNVTPLNLARYDHTATLLEDGRVLVAGGQQGNGTSTNIPLSISEVYNPATTVWTSIPMIAPARYLHAATFLPNGEVLVTGGLNATNQPLNDAQLFDPVQNSWSGASSMQSWHAGHTGTLLPNGKVLIAGGATLFNANSSTTTVEIYQYGAWTASIPATNPPNGLALKTLRSHQTATLLNDGRVFMAGGWNGSGANSSSEAAYFSIYTPSSYAPSISSVSPSTGTAPGTLVTVSGNQLSGVSEGGAGLGYSNGGANYPQVVLRPFDSGGGSSQSGSSYLLNPSTTIFEYPWSDSSLQFQVPQTGCGYYQVAEQADGNMSNFETMLVTPPPVVSSPTVTASASGPTAITYNFPVTNASNYYLYLASAPTQIALWTSSPSVTFQNLSTNTAYGIVVRAENCISTSTLSQAVTVYTLAATPGNLQFVDVSSYSITLAWGSNGNPASTVYDVAYAPHSFGTATSCPSNATCSTILGQSLTLNNLIPGTTYNFAVQAINGAGIGTTFTSLVSTGTEPDVPTDLQGVALGISSVSWSWVGVPWATSYNVYAVNGTTATLLANTTELTYAEAGLSINTTAQVTVQAALGASVGPVSSTGTVLTLAAAPTPHVSGVTSLTASVYWDTDGNPPGTLYSLSYSTDDFHLNVNNAVSFPDDFSGSSFTVTGLAADTTYYFQVMAENFSTLPSTPSVIVSTVTNLNVPLDITGTALGVSSISWTWIAAPFATSYDVFEASASVYLGSTSTTTFVETGLGINEPAQIVARGDGNSITGPFSPASAVAYTMAAVPSTPTIVFVTSTTISTSWTADGNPSYTPYTLQVSPAPDFSSIQLQVSTTSLQYLVAGLQKETSYFLRVDANNGSNVPSSYSASTNTLTTLGGVLQGTLAITQSATFSSILNSNRIASITVPPYTFAQGTQLTVQDSSFTPCGGIPAAVSITVNPPQQPSQAVAFSLSYLPSDVGELNPEDFLLERWDPVTNTCSPLTSSVNTSSMVVTALLNHFSLYQIAYSTPVASMGDAHIWPNPLYISRAGEAFFTIGPLPEGTDVDVYDLLGELVYKTSADASGTAQWPAVNRSGKRVASGIYLVLLKDGGTTKILKAAIER